jgi:transcriptional regulator with XRE-family HTH domain
MPYPWNKAFVVVDGVTYDMKQLGAKLGVTPNAITQRLRRLKKVLGKSEFTLDELERTTRGYVYKQKLPAQYVCRNQIRKICVERGYTFKQLAKKMRTKPQHVDRVLGAVHRKNRYALTPDFVTRAAKALGLPEEDRAELHELGAQENGWLF